MTSKIYLAIFLIPVMGFCQIKGTWKFSLDTTFMGESIKSENFIMFYDDNQIAEFSINDFEETRIYFYTLIKKDKKHFIRRFERNRTHEFNSDDLSQTIDLDGYNEKDFDTIGYRLLANKTLMLTFGSRTLEYKKITSSTFSKYSHESFQTIQTQIQDIDSSLLHYDYETARKKNSKLFSQWLLNDSLLLAFFLENTRYTEHIKNKDSTSIRKIVEQSLESTNREKALKGILCLIYLGISNKELLELYDPSKIYLGN